MPMKPTFRTTRSRSKLPAARAPRASQEDEPRAGRTQVEDLEKQLVDAARVNREILDVLEGLGIDYKPMKVEKTLSH